MFKIVRDLYAHRHAFNCTYGPLEYWEERTLRDRVWADREALYEKQIANNNHYIEE